MLRLCVRDLFVFRWTTKQERMERRYLRAVEKDMERDRIAASLEDRQYRIDHGYRTGVTYKWHHKH